MNAGEQAFAGLLGEIEHDIAQEDDVEAVFSAVEGERWAAQVGLAEVAHFLYFGFCNPVFAQVIEVAHDEASGKAAVDFDAVITAELGAFDDLGANVGPLDALGPAGEEREVLMEEHADAVGFLAGGAGGAPKAEAAHNAARLNQFWQQLGAEQFKGSAVAEEAGFVDGHGLGDGAFKYGVATQFEVLDEFFEMGHALIAQQLGEPRFKEVVTGGIEHVLGKPEDQLAKIAVVHALRCLHD